MKPRHILPTVVILLGTNTCSPQLPESDPVISTDPAAVAALREGHADLLVVLTALEAKAPISILPESPYFEPWAQLSSAIPAVSTVTAAHLRVIEESPPECEEDDHLVLSLDVMTQTRRLQRPRSQQLEIVMCGGGLGEEDAPFTSHLRSEPPVEIDGARLSQILTESTSLMQADVDDYIDDFERQQHRILRTHMGCPDGTLYDHDNDLRLSRQTQEHWCARDGVRHGPYMKGDLGPLLDGVRLIEGHFDNGMRDGHWLTRDESGTVIEESRWSAGELLPPTVAPVAPVAP